MIYVALIYLACIFIILSLMGGILVSHLWYIVLLISVILFLYCLSKLKKISRGPRN
ncbi:hypothetical protein [Acetilactobacillus jinshanensis]|uniref:hypothetical protein n=1 Tax=Acetilactobacillus jinshanensis TaxID=1720083 RepID=UPI0013A67A01|nr:hypothetical protein [Acetilactobacillus jinshanensis]URL61068.1 hypothetical protein HGK75_03465 [uncultured bacterium]